MKIFIFLISIFLSINAASDVTNSESGQASNSVVRDSTKTYLRRSLESLKPIEKIITGDNIYVQEEKDFIQIIFPWETHVKAAFYKRGKYLYAFFDQPKKFTHEQKNQNIISIKNFDTVSYSFVVIELPEGFENFETFKLNEAWVVKSSNKPVDLEFNILNLQMTKIKMSKISLSNIKTEFANNIDHEILKKSIIFETGNFNKAYVVYDPIIGDYLQIVPFYLDSTGSSKRQFVDFNILPTFQGFVIQILSDKIRIFCDPLNNMNGIFIYSPHFSDSSHTKIKNPQKTIFSSKFFDKTLVKEGPDFMLEKQNLLIAISKSTNSEEKYNSKMKLAKFLFSNKLYYESLGVLEGVANTYAQLFNTNQHNLSLLIISSVICNRFEYAATLLESFNSKYLEEALEPEILFWGNFNNWMLGENTANVNFLENIDGFIAPYHNSLKFKLALSDLKQSLTSKQFERAELIFKKIDLSWAPNKNDINSFEFMKAMYYVWKENNIFGITLDDSKGVILPSKLEVTVELSKAIEILSRIAGDINDTYNRPKAELELVKIKYIQKQMSNEEAIEALDSIRYVTFENEILYNLLTAIAFFQKKKEDYIAALRTYKYIVNSFDYASNDIFVTNNMMNMYEKIFGAEGIAYKMSPYEAVSLFYEFRTLTPIGSVGDDIALQISKRLINLDLFDEVETLLKHQVNFRQQDKKRIDVADKLALIYLLNKKPQEAIKIIIDTDNENFSFEVFQQRNRFKASALEQLNREKEALSLIAYDKSIEAEYIRRDIYFKLAMWDKFILSLESEIEASLGSGTELSDATKENILKLIIAYFKAGDISAVARLNIKIPDQYALLKNTAKFFEITQDPVSLKNFEESVRFNDVSSFLKQYKANL